MTSVIRGRRVRRLAVAAVTVIATSAGLLVASSGVPAVPDDRSRSTAGPDVRGLRHDVIEAVAHDESAPLRRLAARYGAESQRMSSASRDRDPAAPVNGSGRAAATKGFTGDPARQSVPAGTRIAPPTSNFEGISNQDNRDVFGFTPNPPDPVGDVGLRHYVEMVNILFSVYTKAGKEVIPPTDIGALWAGFRVQDCTDPAGDPIVVYDQLANRWILTQFTIRGFETGGDFYNCVAISTSSDPTGSYYRYAFSSGENFPDYPKYGVWTDTYTITTREFGPEGGYGIGVYGLEKSKMLRGRNARAVSFFINGNRPRLLPLVGDGLLPADIDGTQLPRPDAAIPLVGTQDDDYFYGATSDALNIWDFAVDWGTRPQASLRFADQIPVDSFDSNYPCHPGPRDCLAQPRTENRDRHLDILSYRQRPTWRLAYRNFGRYESLVTNQSVEAAPHLAGVRWYEVRRNTAGAYRVHQQGTYAPGDRVHRWMGSIAQDRFGNMALGYSVVNGAKLEPGIRYTGRRAGDALGQMTLGEGSIIEGTGVQRKKNSRWGDYTSMNIDPVDDCTFWYVNEYYSREGQMQGLDRWQTRIASFRLPGC